MVDERYTSKICSKCGNLKEDLGGNKIYKCNECKMEIDRDVNS
jgi:putative transposase